MNRIKGVCIIVILFGSIFNISCSAKNGNTNNQGFNYSETKDISQNEDSTISKEINKSSLNIDDFKFLRLGMTISEVEKVVGKPDFQTGSGFLKDAYKLDDESYIELNYGPGLDALRSANIKYKDGTKEPLELQK